MPFRVITFDLDDTLWDVRPALIEAERLTRAWLEQHAPDMLRTFDAHALAAIRHELVANEPALAHQLSRLRRDTYFHALLRTGYQDREAARLADDAFQVFLDARHGVDPFPGVAELLAELAPRYRLGALSNGNADLRRIAIGAHFDFHLSAEHVGAAKPDPAMFDAALAHAGVAPAEMLHVGDNAEHDVQGASNAGVPSIWVNPQGIAYPEHLDARPLAQIASVLELRELLARL